MIYRVNKSVQEGQLSLIDHKSAALCYTGANCIAERWKLHYPTDSTTKAIPECMYAVYVTTNMTSDPDTVTHISGKSIAVFAVWEHMVSPHSHSTRSQGVINF